MKHGLMTLVTAIALATGLPVAVAATGVSTPADDTPTPVWPHYLADPFVLKTGGAYYAYGTGEQVLQPDGRVFPVLRSTDLRHWSSLGGALQPLASPKRDAYWAPEVAERNGKFYMYYSAAAGDDQNQRVRVAIASRPEGPFVDAGRELLPNQGFTIDADPFHDPKDGKWYLSYAKDFFDGRVGTGTAVIRLNDDMVSTTGPAKVMVRATADWQIYERNRHHYGKTWDKWHTVEGPFLVAHGGKYYAFYSGGPWNTSRYGVSFAVADTPLGPYHEPPGATGPTVLREIPGKVLGPGHNAVVKGPDGRTDYIVYHGWDPGHTARRMFVAPITWTPAGPQVGAPIH